MSTKSVAGLGLIKRFFKVVEFTEISSRPLAVQGTAKYQIVGLRLNLVTPPPKPPEPTSVLVV